MTAQEYVDGLAAEDALEDLGALGEEFRVLDRRRGIGMAVPVEVVARMAWRDLRPVLIGTRPARALSRITRIVGYFSMEQNWNRSKLAEGADRRNGDYRLDGRGGGAFVTVSDELPQYMLDVLAGGREDGMRGCRRPKLAAIPER